MADFTLEAAHGGLVAGVDEVGRGPLAGPVITAAAILDPSRLPADLLAAIDDSKKLSAKRRQQLAEALIARRNQGVMFALAAASVAVIDRDNILTASLDAMTRAVQRLPQRPDLVLVDGNRLPRGLTLPAQAVVGGDGKSLSIAAASILAKVARDRLMARLAERWPGYDWEQNAGYPTARHRAALAKHGITPHHRRSFAPVAAALGIISA